MPKSKLRMVKAGTLSAARGHATIIAEAYSTSIECDVDNYSARFVAVVKPDRGLAAAAREMQEC